MFIWTLQWIESIYMLTEILFDKAETLSEDNSFFQTLPNVINYQHKYTYTWYISIAIYLMATVDVPLVKVNWELAYCLRCIRIIYFITFYVNVNIQPPTSITIKTHACFPTLPSSLQFKLGRCWIFKRIQYFNLKINMFALVVLQSFFTFWCVIDSVWISTIRISSESHNLQTYSTISDWDLSWYWNYMYIYYFIWQSIIIFGKKCFQYKRKKFSDISIFNFGKF